MKNGGATREGVIGNTGSSYRCGFVRVTRSTCSTGGGWTDQGQHLSRAGAPDRKLYAAVWLGCGEEADDGTEGIENQGRPPGHLPRGGSRRSFGAWQGARR